MGAILIFLGYAYILSRKLHVALITRQCSPQWEGAIGTKHKKIAMISLSDSNQDNSNVYTAKSVRKFKNVVKLTRENRVAYSSLMGYDYIDASDVLDASRPASWSKIKAVLKHLKRYDWVMWIDADAYITNRTVRIESLLPSEDGPDLILTRDSTGYNAGMWLARNCSWTHKFLENWWSMKQFIRPAGETKSGDNDALKHYLFNMPAEELRRHVGVAPQCAFNSYIWHNSARMWKRYVLNPALSEQGLWKPGDFILHLAGVNNKEKELNKAIHRLAVLPHS